MLTTASFREDPIMTDDAPARPSFAARSRWGRLATALLFTTGAVITLGLRWYVDRTVVEVEDIDGVVTTSN